MSSPKKTFCFLRPTALFQSATATGLSVLLWSLFSKIISSVTFLFTVRITLLPSALFQTNNHRSEFITTWAPSNSRPTTPLKNQTPKTTRSQHLPTLRHSTSSGVQPVQPVFQGADKVIGFPPSSRNFMLAFPVLAEVIATDL